MPWYWVNQGQHQAAEVELGVISAPVPKDRTVAHWELDRIPVGSRLFGCAHRVVSIVGTTSARAERRPSKPYPDPQGYRDVWVVAVDWEALGDPFRVDDIPLSVRAGHAPFNRHGDGLQQYCIELPLLGPVRAWLAARLPA